MLTHDQKEKIAVVFGEYAPRFESEVVRISRIFEHYLLDGFKVPVANKKVQAIIIGYGYEGAQETMAMHLATKRAGVDAAIKGVEINYPEVRASSEQLRKLIDAGLSELEEINLTQGDIFSSRSFEDMDPNIPILFIIRDIFPYPFPADVTERLVPEMNRWYRRGLDSRLIVISRTGGYFEEGARAAKQVKEALRELNLKGSRAQIVKFTEESPYVEESSDSDPTLPVFDGTVITVGYTE